MILLSYIGILWSWSRTYAVYHGISRTGRLFQLLGYSFLVVAGLLLCSYIGDPQMLALTDVPTASAESVSISLAISMLLLFVGHDLIAPGVQKPNLSPETALKTQPGTTD
ncbi:MAG: hypothetical protein JSV42_19150 [Chloroflexota bacterium]|nr:MAG: hypothetical protein JSV42_19150 [Chloroflexota bacterium]